MAQNPRITLLRKYWLCDTHYFVNTQNTQTVNSWQSIRRKEKKSTSTPPWNVSMHQWEHQWHRYQDDWSVHQGSTNVVVATSIMQRPHATFDLPIHPHLHKRPTFQSHCPYNNLRKTGLLNRRPTLLLHWRSAEWDQLGPLRSPMLPWYIDPPELLFASQYFRNTR